MNRREALAATGAVLAAAVVPAPEQVGEPLAVVHKLVGREWVRCRMYELTPGDLFHTSNMPGDVHRAVCLPTKNEDGRWEIQGLYKVGDKDKYPPTPSV